MLATSSIFPIAVWKLSLPPTPWPVTIYMCTLQSSGFSLDGASSQLAWSTSGQCCQGLSPVWSISPMVWQWERLFTSHQKCQAFWPAQVCGTFSVFPNSQPQLLCDLEYEINTLPWYAKVWEGPPELLLGFEAICCKTYGFQLSSTVPLTWTFKSNLWSGLEARIPGILAQSTTFCDVR